MLHKWFSRLISSPCVASLFLGREMATWVVVKSPFVNNINLLDVLAKGRFSQEGLSVFESDGSPDESFLKATFSQLVNQADKLGIRVQSVIVVMPSTHGFLGEFTVEQTSGHAELYSQLEDMLAGMVVGHDAEVSFDWIQRPESTTADGLEAVAVGAISSAHLEKIGEVANSYGLKLVGLTFDSICLANVYTDKAEGANPVDLNTLLVADVQRRSVRLSVFQDGLVVNESSFDMEIDFSAVQAVGALEKLVSAWLKGNSVHVVQASKLALFGELGSQSSFYATASRSDILRTLLSENAKQVQEDDWCLYQAPIGALKGLPCA